MQAGDVTMIAPRHASGSAAGAASDMDPIATGGTPRGARRISVHVPQFVIRSIDRISGGSLVAIALLGCIALATWNAADPSITFANDKSPSNWLGYAGASFADIAMQFFGFASVVLLLPPLVWGLFKWTARPLGLLKTRFGFWALALGLLSSAASCLAVPNGWPLPVGMGGVLGDAVLGFPAAFLGNYPGGAFAVVLGAVFFVPGFWALLRACRLTKGIPARAGAVVADSDAVEESNVAFDDFAETDDGSRDWFAIAAMPIGLAMHLYYSARAGLSNMAGRRAERHQAAYLAKMQQQGMQPQAPHAPMAQQPHVEPHFDAQRPNTFVPAADADDNEDWIEPEVTAYEPVTIEPQAEAIAMPDYDVAPSAPVASKPAPAPAQAVRAKAKTGGKFSLPNLDLLSEERNLVQDETLSKEQLEENARTLEGVLEDFGVKGQIIAVRPGPVVTLYELEPAPGIKSSRVIGLADDIARSMSAIAARVAVVPGRNAIGIELPNKKRETVYLRQQLSSKEFKQSKMKLPMCLGKDIGGAPIIADMAKMPHLLVAGTTGSGKSVAINTMILSLLYKHGPDKCKLIMIDPKMLELSIYDGIPHLLTPVVVDPKKAVVALKWSVREMEERYKKMSKVGVRNIDGFNARVEEAAAKGENITRTVQTGFDRDTGEAIYEVEELDLEPMPYIVVVIDEMADLMMVAGKDIEGTVQRLAQMARAAGIHVIMATQRPSTDVITGTIKANFPTRISFQVTSKIDSRVMLGESGAEQLLGMGDMLYMAGGGRITRVHGPFVDDPEVEAIVNHLKAQGVPQYLEGITEEDEEDEGGSEGGGGGAAGGLGDSDDPYDQAVAIVLRDRKASTSYIQRRLSVGYNKAASLIERMEQEGVISPANHAGKREILVPAEDETI
ncbi:DNA translocase FtsK 4TM domain-containing protein [Pseudahrensia aquimaris]|uniref:DNA translocase FtsK n=1 Tax=Pseudahrensia aquimaris TaxID=744461 RepID=A0ABW3FGM0_9HYPH